MEKIKLDRYQKKVIKNKSKNLLVIAGAGCGKTLTIIYKIKYLIKKHIMPEEILCITFTKSAAAELQNKLKKENIYIKVKTFHSLGYEIIKRNQQVKLIDNQTLEKIIINKLKKFQNLYQIINVKFTEIGKGNIPIIKNNILINSKYFPQIINIIKTFINLFKSNNYNLFHFNKFHQINKKENFIKIRKRHKLFLNLVKQIYQEYQTYLKETNQIDFHDMINKATEIIKEDGIYPYKYIIIDEYQDTSLNKCELIKEIQLKTNAKLIAVGDDWQSIYQFTGSNLEIFLNFKKYFPKAKIIKLKQTYRNNQELLKVAKKFIMQNKNQINKKLFSKKHETYPIHIYYYQNSIKEIWSKIPKNNKTIILGRNQKDLNKVPKLNNMKYMTIHKSKGLEAEKVIIINLENAITGFPNKIKNNEYLQYLTQTKTNYEEERRLFYVALTRTKTNNILLVNKNNPSIFITEILKQSKKYIKIIDNNVKNLYNKKRVKK